MASKTSKTGPRSSPDPAAIVANLAEELAVNLEMHEERAAWSPDALKQLRAANDYLKALGRDVPEAVETVLARSAVKKRSAR
jgi:hypothetical protein